MQEIDPVASHASWMENFPWTRLEGVVQPSQMKPMIDMSRMRTMSPEAVRSYLGDGNFGGYYERPDDGHAGDLGRRCRRDARAARERLAMSGPILIWGAGAIGGSIGAALIRAGEDVVFVDRAADHVAALNERGLQIVGPVESYRVPAKAMLPQDVSGTFDRIMLCVKAHDTADATRALLRISRPTGMSSRRRTG